MIIQNDASPCTQSPVRSASSLAAYQVFVRCCRYGLLVLLIEIISSTATLGYAILLVKYSKSRRTKGLPIPKKGQQPDLDNLKFHVRVLIPCYKESCELVKLTVLGALKAPLPKVGSRAPAVIASLQCVTLECTNFASCSCAAVSCSSCQAWRPVLM